MGGEALKSIVGSIVDALTPTRSGQPPVPVVNNYVRSVPMFGGASLALNAMGANGTLYNVLSTYANGTSRVGWHLYRKRRPGSDPEAPRQEVFSHLALDVWNRPNPYDTQQKFVESTQQHVDLVGEGYWCVARNVFGWPESMWLVRPDRIQPVPSAEYGLAGYIYTGPNGQQVPLLPEDVIPLKMPNPADPGPCGRGLGATQTILMQLEAVYFSAQFNRNFFANSALPGGVLEVEDTLSDQDFMRLRTQWGELHQGVSNASRVGILENGIKWVDTATTQRDMQFVELLNTSREIIREAFGFPKAMTGDVTDVNRASMNASLAMFSTERLVPRLDRIKDVLNTWFLPMFGPSGHGSGQPDVEFDYDNPTPEDLDAENASLTTKTNAFKTLIDAGVDPIDAAEAAGLPVMSMAPVILPNKEQPAVAPPQPDSPPPADPNAPDMPMAPVEGVQNA